MASSCVPGAPDRRQDSRSCRQPSARCSSADWSRLAGTLSTACRARCSSRLGWRTCDSWLKIGVLWIPCALPTSGTSLGCQQSAVGDWQNDGDRGSGRSRSARPLLAVGRRARQRNGVVGPGRLPDRHPGRSGADYAERVAPRVWSGEAPKFANEEQAQLILSTVMGRYNAIAEALETEPDELDPVFWEQRDGTVIAADWAEGFREAIELRPGSWTPLFQDAEASSDIVPRLQVGRGAGEPDRDLR